ncbi:hypothetical protein CS8_085910 [Cupriavidus sp. 8B]
MRVAMTGGIFHLWGHSWELDSFGGWQVLEDFLRFGADYFPKENRVTNSELFDFYTANKQ